MIVAMIWLQVGCSVLSAIWPAVLYLKQCAQGLGARHCQRGRGGSAATQVIERIAVGKVGADRRRRQSLRAVHENLTHGRGAQVPHGRHCVRSELDLVGQLGERAKARIVVGGEFE